MKPGKQTTEFWLTTGVVMLLGLVPVLQDLWTGLQPVIPDSVKPYAMAISVGAYAIARAIPKAAEIVFNAYNASQGAPIPPLPAPPIPV